MNLLCTLAPVPILGIGTSSRIQKVRDQFPFFAENPDVTYLDSSATTQMPSSVIDSIADFHIRRRANAGRASYRLSSQAARGIEATRRRVATFLNAEDPSQVVFTTGSTDSLNMVALSWGLHNLRDGDEILVCADDHKSTVLPWLALRQTLAAFGVKIKIVPFKVHPEGDYELKSIRAGLSPRTRLLTMTHVHHIYGVDMEVDKVREVVGPDVLISLDSSQAVGHRCVDVQDLGVDFVSFPGHKMFAETGVGVLWCHPRVHGELWPVRVGGQTPGFEQVDGSLPPGSVPPPQLLECGTQNAAAIISMHAAIDFIDSLGIDLIEGHVSRLAHYLRHELSVLPGIVFAPGFSQCGCAKAYGIVAFRFEQYPTTDVAALLDAEDVFVRSGGMCKTIQSKGDDFMRASLHVYNARQDIDRLVDVLRTHLD